MRHANRRLIILLLLVLGCALAWYFLMRKPVPTEEPKAEALLAIGDPSSVTGISVGGKETEAYTITKNGDLLMLDEPAAIALSEPYLNVIWEDLLSLEAAPVDAAVSDEMEFSDPVLTISYLADDEELQEVRVGRYTSVRGGYYALGRGETVWLLGQEIVEKLQGARQEFYIRNLLDFSSEQDFERLQSITVTPADPDAVTIRVEKDATFYHLSLPYTYICEYKALKVGLLDPAAHLKGTRYVADSVLPEYGFEEPRYTVTYEYDGEEIQVLFGAKTEEGTYVRRSDKEEVFLIRDEDIAFLETPAAELIGSSVYSRYINFVDRFRIRYHGEEDEFDLENAPDYSDKWNLVYNGKTYQYEQFIAFFNAVMGAEKTRELEKEETETDPDEELTIEVVLKSGETDTVILKPISVREYEAVVNGECHFTTTASEVEEIVKRLQEWRGSL